jgi:SNF2 family DNA or RNA helicase
MVALPPLLIAGVVLQAEDRIHRLGQLAKEVRIIYMIARNTVDEIVWEQIQRKHQVVGATVGADLLQSYCATCLSLVLVLRSAPSRR